MKLLSYLFGSYLNTSFQRFEEKNITLILCCLRIITSFFILMLREHISCKIYKCKKKIFKFPHSFQTTDLNVFATSWLAAACDASESDHNPCVTGSTQEINAKDHCYYLTDPHGMLHLPSIDPTYFYVHIRQTTVSYNVFYLCIYLTPFSPFSAETMHFCK